MIFGGASDDLEAGVRVGKVDAKAKIALFFFEQDIEGGLVFLNERGFEEHRFFVGVGEQDLDITE